MEQNPEAVEWLERAGWFHSGNGSSVSRKMFDLIPDHEAHSPTRGCSFCGRDPIVIEVES